MKFDWVRRLAAGLIFFMLIYGTLENTYNIYQSLFGLAVCVAFVYEHGYKLDFKAGHKRDFFLFYAVPFGIAVISVVLRVFNLLN